MMLADDQVWNAVDSTVAVASVANEDARIAELAKLSPLEYERNRKDTAAALGIREVALDKAVNLAKRVLSTNDSAGDGNGGGAILFDEVVPWDDPVDGAQLLSDIADTIRRFIICDMETARAASLWIAFTWFIDHVQVAPIAMITAPEKRCGKTQLLDLFGRLCNRPLAASNISASAIFRCVEAWKPTLLIDEADAFLRDNEDARGILNSGHTRQSAFVIRIVGESLEPRRFSTWGAKAIAGIGRLADTLTDRSIALELRRKLPGEQADKLRHAEPTLFVTLTKQLARWSTDSATTVRNARPESVAALNDRAADNWEPLLAIADVAGGEWPELARKAALRLSGAVQDTPSINAELLADIQEVFADKKLFRIATADLIEALCNDEEKPWATWNKGRQMSARQLSARLDGFGINSHQIRFGTTNRRGYEVADFADAFTRYLPPTPTLSATPLQASNHAGFSGFLSATQQPAVANEKSPKPSNGGGCSTVADKTEETDSNTLEEWDI